MKIFLISDLGEPRLVGHAESFADADRFIEAHENDPSWEAGTDAVVVGDARVCGSGSEEILRRRDGLPRRMFLDVATA